MSASASISVVIVTGFIKNICCLLENNQIIPNEVYNLCCLYYQISTKLLLICPQNANEFYITDLDNNKKMICNVEYIDKSGKSNDWNICTVGLLYCKNISLPSQLSNNIKSNTKYNAIFKCGRTSSGFGQDNYSAVIFENDNLTAGWNYKLPINWAGVSNNVLIYNNEQSSHHGLISIGGTDTLYYLPFNALNISYDAWKWKEITSMSEDKELVSCVMIDNCKLCVIGGVSPDNVLNCMEIYDLQQNKWRYKDEIDSMSQHRCAAGIFYDKEKSQIYIGGGMYSVNYEDGLIEVAECIVEFYDVYKNKWFQNLPDTLYKHPWNPNVWIEHNNILNIVSVNGEYIEWIDLRINDKFRHKLINGKISNMFQTNSKLTDDPNTTLLHNAN
eukprot:386683_1